MVLPDVECIQVVLMKTIKTTNIALKDHFEELFYQCWIHYICMWQLQWNMKTIQKNNEDNEYVDTIANIGLFHLALIEMN